MRFRYYTVDVFTDIRFGGNPLAVLPEAGGLTTQQMQAITREFNFSETAFVFPPAEPVNQAHVRIFTPTHEVPFAGHPNVGTASVLARIGALSVPTDGEYVAKFEEAAGVVPVRIKMAGGQPRYTELTAPEPLFIGDRLSPRLIADAISLSLADLEIGEHTPRIASVGLPFVIAELVSPQALADATVSLEAFRALADETGVEAVHLFTRAVADETSDLQTRMFAPLHGVGEDPATGSANCALGGLLVALTESEPGEYRYRIAQGREMGRPSTLLASVVRGRGSVEAVRIGGSTVAVADGWIEVE